MGRAFRLFLGLALIVPLFPSPGHAALSYTWTFGGAERVFTPWAITTDNDANVYLLDTGNNRVVKYKLRADREETLVTEFVSKFGDDRLSAPEGIAFGSERLYVSDTSGRVFMFTTDGGFLGSFGEPGSEDGQFGKPASVDVDSLGFVYVADTYNERVQKFTADGDYVDQWGSEGTGDGQFAQSGPAGIAIDSADNVYVSDELAHRVQKFSSSGTFIAKWGSHGTGPGQFEFPDEMTVDADDNVWVAESGINTERVQQFDSTGKLLREITGPKPNTTFVQPHGIEIDDKGNLFVVSSGEHRAYLFANALPEVIVASINWSGKAIRDKKSLLYEARYNQSFERCTGSAVGRVFLPKPFDESFSVSNRDIVLRPGRTETVRVGLSREELSNVMEVIGRGKEIKVEITFKFECSDNEKPTKKLKHVALHEEDKVF